MRPVSPHITHGGLTRQPPSCMYIVHDEVTPGETSVFDDDRAIVIEDEHPDDSEERFVIFGMDADGRILAVAHTISGDNIRIISARLATPNERAQYEDKRI